MKNDVKALVSAAIFLTLLFSVVTLDLRPAFTGGSPRVQTYRGWDTGAANPENAVGVAQFIFGPFAVPLIILSTALLVALVGAVFLAKPGPLDEEEQA